MTPRSFAVVSFFLCCLHANAASSVCNVDGGVEQSCRQGDDPTDAIGLMQTKAVVEKSIQPHIQDDDKLVPSDLGNEMNEVCGNMFGCDEPPAEFVISKEGLKYVEIDLDNYDHSSAELPEDDESLEFVTSQEAMQDFGKSFSNSMAEEVANFNEKLAAVQKEYQDEYRKLHPNETSSSDWNWDWEMKDDPAEFVDGDAPDWEEKIRQVRPGLSDDDYQLGKALYTIYSLVQWNIFDPFGLVKKSVQAVKNAVNSVKKAASGLTFFVDLGKNMIKIVKMLQGLINCLAHLPQKYSIVGIMRFAVNTARKPGGLLANLIPDTWNTYMTPFISGTEKFVQQQLASGHQKYHKSQSLADQIFAKVEQFAKIPGMGALGCLSNNLIKPAFKAVGHVIDGYVKLIVTPVTKVFNKFVSAPNGFVAKFISKVGQLVKTVLPVAQLIAKTAKSKSSEFCLQMLTKIKQGKPLPTTQQKLLLVGAATLDTFLIKFFDDGVNSLLSPILEKAVDFVGQLLQTGLHALDGLCGLIPEAGAAVCALVSNIVGGGYGIASRALLKGGMSFVKTEGANIIKQSSSFIAQALNSAMSKKVHLPALFMPFVPLIQGFVKVIQQHINQYLGKCNAILPTP